MRFNLDNYETVEARLAKFWEDNPNGQIFTQIHYYDENRVVFKAEAYKDIADPRPVATGFAEEVRDASPVNKTSHVENAETSAIGRCLSNWKYQSKGAPRPSREEMQKVARMQEQPQPSSPADLMKKFREACAKDGLDPETVAKEAGVDLNELTDADFPKLRDQFKKKLAERLIEPRVVAHRLRGSAERYKIKLRRAGYRLVYEVRDQQLLVMVLAVGRRDRNAVYRQADRR
jgi:mRNA interferase RelE/StbE